MGKGDKRGKVKPKGFPELAPIKPRGKQPREGGRFAAPVEDAQRVALTARCHHYTKAEPTKDERAKAKAPHLGSHLGMVMERECPKDVPRLWRVWQAFCQVERNYFTRIIGQTGTPKGASIAMIRDKIESDTGHSVDIRTAAEKDGDAVKAWMRWRGFIGHLDAAESSALFQAYRDNGPAIWRDRKPTRHGLVTLAALVRLADVAGM